MGDAMNVIQDETVVVVMLESPEAISRADAIAAVPGVDMLLIGAFDLSRSLGIMGQFGDQRFRDAIDTAAAACRKHGRTLGLAGVGDLAMLGEFVAAGVRFISGGTETGLFMTAATARAAALAELSARIDA
jgi:2-keto-3-deoxy-L-rhamnonate aldolase RhmA